VNTAQKALLGRLVLQHFGGGRGLTFALWGLAFKPRTDDVREAPALSIAKVLLEAGASLRLHDPVARQTFTTELPPSPQVTYCQSNYEAATGADALLLVTEWPAYRRPDFRRLKELMRQPVLFDGRNIWEPQIVRELGFHYACVGRP
jgi:UDPglucose 6-dehydrogenase